jgi:hypothetical protein
MATIEHVEKLREKANVSYAEAKAALDACGDDVLEALLYLERQGKVNPPDHGGFYSSKDEQKEKKGDITGTAQSSEPKGESFVDLMGRFFRWIRGLFVKSCENRFDVQRGDSQIITMPVLVLILLLIFCFWLVIPLLIIGLFFGCHYRFRGRDLEKTAVNKVMESAENAAETLKTDIKEAADKSKERSE